MAGPSLKVLGPKEILSLQELTMDTCEVVLTFESVDEILWCCHSSETSSAVLSHGTIYLLSSSNVWVCGWNLMVWPFKWNLPPPTFSWCCSQDAYCVVLTFDTVDDILLDDHLNETSSVVLSHGTIYLVWRSPKFWDCGWNPTVWPFKWNPERHYYTYWGLSNTHK